MIGEHAGEEPSMVLGRTTAGGRWREQWHDPLPAVVGQLDKRPGESVGSGAVQVGWRRSFPSGDMTLLGI
jgi:hypothetical protein